MNNTPNSNTIKSFALGYKVIDSTVNNVGEIKDAVVATASETKNVSASFFAGMKFAIQERRAQRKANKISEPSVTKQDIEDYRREENERKFKEAQELYARANTPSDQVTKPRVRLQTV